MFRAEVIEKPGRMVYRKHGISGMARVIASMVTLVIALMSFMPASQAQAATVQKDSITFQGHTAPFDDCKIYVDLRTDGPHWWARARWVDNNTGGGNTEIGTVELQLRKRAANNSWGSWVTVRSATLRAGSSSVWTDSSYDPPSNLEVPSYQVRAGFRAPTYIGYPSFQATKAFYVG